MAPYRSRGTAFLAAATATFLASVAPAQHRRHCPDGQHRSAGHCCNAGEEWVEARNACVCLEPNGCPQPEAPDAGTGAAAATPPPTSAPPPPPAGTCPDGMLQIPAGLFWMGSSSGDGDVDELPQHRVTVSPFCIDRTEVTVSQYRSCAQNGGCTAASTTVTFRNPNPAEVNFWSQLCNGARTDRENHPINCVNWTQADAYCRWKGGRLPTEAEWEFAARGNEGRRFPWGNTSPAPSLVNACGSECRNAGERMGRRFQIISDASDNFETTAPVGSFAMGASPFGVMDMAGNVWEWTNDWYANYTPGDAADPTGPTSGTERSIRSSSWYASNGDAIRSADRNRADPGTRLATLGFRCVLPSAQLSATPTPTPAPPPATTPPARPRH